MTLLPLTRSGTPNPGVVEMWMLALEPHEQVPSWVLTWKPFLYGTFVEPCGTPEILPTKSVDRGPCVEHSGSLILEYFINRRYTLPLWKRICRAKGTLTRTQTVREHRYAPTDEVHSDRSRTFTGGSTCELQCHPLHIGADCLLRAVFKRGIVAGARFLIMINLH